MKKCSTFIGLALVTILCLTAGGCGTGASADNSTPATKPEPTINTDPRHGWVKVIDSITEQVDGQPFINVFKHCDGATLLYVTPGNASGAHGVTAIANSRECQT